MMRSHDAFTGASGGNGRCGDSAGAFLGPQAPTPNPIAAIEPVVRNVRLCMSALSLDALRDREIVKPRRVGAAVAPDDRDIEHVGPARMDRSEAALERRRQRRGVFDPL